MSNLTRSSYRNGTNGAHRPSVEPTVEFYALDDKLRDEMKQLSEVNTELLGKLHTDPEIQLGSLPQPEERQTGAEEEVREENARLLQRLAETEQLVEQAVAHEESWIERQKEYEALLDEKSEVIRGLHLKVKEFQDGPAQATRATPAKAGENAEAALLKKELEEERRQLRRDEESVMQQMRQMEMAMSRDRAELARQRSELQRLQADLNHEIEMASRDPVLRDRLLSLQRHQQDVLTRKGGAAPAVQPSSAPAQPQPQAEPETPSAKKSGFFGRLFGK